MDGTCCRALLLPRICKAVGNKQESSRSNGSRPRVEMQNRTTAYFAAATAGKSSLQLDVSWGFSCLSTVNRILNFSLFEQLLPACRLYHLTATARRLKGARSNPIWRCFELNRNKNCSERESFELGLRAQGSSCVWAVSVSEINGRMYVRAFVCPLDKVTLFGGRVPEKGKQEEQVKVIEISRELLRTAFDELLAAFELVDCRL